MITDLQSRIDLHKKFWQGGLCDRLPVSFRIGDYFFADKFAAGRKLLVPGKIIEPAMIRPEEFLEDYDRMYNDTRKIGQSGFFAAEPYVGIPWLEAILGCPVIASGKSFVAEPCLDESGCLPEKFDLDNNEWFAKYLEFTEVLVQHSAGRYPAAQPIMRGLSDAFGALAGQQQMIYHLYDQPQESRKLIAAIAEAFVKIINAQYELIPQFHGGCSIGFYHVWTPGKCIWFQEDLSSILSPDLFAEFILPHWQDICAEYDYNLIHLHPSSFHNLDLILGIEKLQAVEINKDEEGPGIRDLLPVCRKVLNEGKRLILWGNLTTEEVILVKENFIGEPVFLNIVADNWESARTHMEIIDQK